MYNIGCADSLWRQDKWYFKDCLTFRPLSNTVWLIIPNVSGRSYQSCFCNCPTKYTGQVKSYIQKLWILGNSVDETKFRASFSVPSFSFYYQPLRIPHLCHRLFKIIIMIIIPFPLQVTFIDCHGRNRVPYSGMQNGWKYLYFVLYFCINIFAVVCYLLVQFLLILLCLVCYVSLSYQSLLLYSQEFLQFRLPRQSVSNICDLKCTFSGVCVLVISVVLLGCNNISYCVFCGRKITHSGT